ncbi:hypothetical protein N7G274_001903 [Stereocaulon virgatum]|uniref:Uncharacterized protein n=1 Tax=Stereocaulon virgatum TaxID=373712 RepID=A0ABR4AJ48_9LECA
MPVHDPYDPYVVLYSDPFEDAAENLDFGTVKGVARLEVNSQPNPVSIPFQPKKAGISSKEEVCPACAGSKRPKELDEKIGSCTTCRRSFSQHGNEHESRINDGSQTSDNTAQSGPAWSLASLPRQFGGAGAVGYGCGRRESQGTADIWTNAYKSDR